MRLRAACQYWGFIRNLERSVVLEGKFMNEEQQAVGANMSSLDLPKDIASTPPPKSEQVETLEKAAAAAESEQRATSDGSEDAKMDDAMDASDVAAADKTEDEETEEAKTGAGKIKEEIQGETSAKTADEFAPSDASDAGSAQKSDEKDESGSVKEGSEEDKKPAGEDDDFADAPSSPTAEAKLEDSEDKEEEEIAKADDMPADAAEASSDAKEDESAVTEAVAGANAHSARRFSRTPATQRFHIRPKCCLRLQPGFGQCCNPQFVSVRNCGC